MRIGAYKLKYIKGLHLSYFRSKTKAHSNSNNSMKMSILALPGHMSDWKMHAFCYEMHTILTQINIVFVKFNIVFPGTNIQSRFNYT